MALKVRKVVVHCHNQTPNGVTKAWRDRVDFTTSTGSLWSQHTNYVSDGRLSDDERAKLAYAEKRARAAGTKLFVVYSYATPIAWVWTSKRGVEHVYKVSQKFSITTSKHQGTLY